MSHPWFPEWEGLETLKRQSGAIRARDRLLAVERFVLTLDNPAALFTVRTCLFEVGQDTDCTFPARAWIN